MRAPEPPAVPAPKTALRRILLLAGLLVLAAGAAGGFHLYRRHQEAAQIALEIEQGLRTARAAIVEGDRQHWSRAMSAAHSVLERDKRHPEANGIVAQALLAAAIDEGIDRDARLRDARAMLEPVKGGHGHIAAIQKAEALDLLLAGDHGEATKRLAGLVERHDADALLYLGWAQLAGGAYDDAIATFTRSTEETPKRVIPALYGIARAQLAKDDRAAARETFLAVIGSDKDHIGALVGDAEAMPPGDFAQREAALLAILQRKDIDRADVAVVARAWTLAGDDARRAGRLDAARERYRKALAREPTAVTTLVSMAALELRDNKIDAAVEVGDRALALAPADVGAILVATELDIRRGRLDEAATRLTGLRDRTPPLKGEQLGQLHLLDGLRLEATGQLEAALGAYELSAKAIGKDAVTPIVAAATLLGKMAATAATAKDDAKAHAFRARADALLSGLASRAETDPDLAITLGVTYLSSGAAAQSEAWLRKALARRPDDVEVNFQLAEALRQQGKQDDAIAALSKAFELDPSRVDLGVELARTFEAAGRDTDASTLYKRLLEGRAVSIDVRIRAGRFFARVRDIPAARIQGEEILKVDELNPAGLFLRAEGLLADGRSAEARRLFKQAVGRDADAQYLDGLGRASEAEAVATGDTALRDDALRTYIEASELAPTMLHPILARGRLHLAARDHAKALAAYESALAIDPNHVEIPYGIGIAYDELDEPANAIKWLNRAIALQPRADAYFRLGSLYYEGNQPGPAAAALARATELGLKDERQRGVTVPWLTNAYRILGSVELLLRRDDAARRAWESYLDRGPTDAVQAAEVRRELLGLRGR